MRRIPPSFRRFSTYTAVGVSTLLFDLLMLYIAVSIFAISYVIATPVAFLIAVTCNYVLSRRFVFKGTERGVSYGYVQFAGAAVLGAVAITLLVTFLVSTFALYYLFARVLVAGVVGVVNYLFNLYVNFKVVGKH